VLKAPAISEADRKLLQTVLDSVQARPGN
jgi:hypothetical protein